MSAELFLSIAGCAAFIAAYTIAYCFVCVAYRVFQSTQRTNEHELYGHNDHCRTQFAQRGE